MKLHTNRFGPVEIAESRVIRFDHGILGFENQKRYVILDHKTGGRFKFLQSVDEPALTFVIVDPRCVDPNYVVEVTREEVQELDIPSSEAPYAVYAIVRVPGDPKEATVNLRAPLVIGETSRRGKQVIQERYSLRERLFPQESVSFRPETSLLCING